MKRVLLVGAVVAAPLLLAGPAWAHTKFSVTAQVSCGQVTYRIHADKATVLTATDVTGGFPLVNSQWTAPKGSSTHTYRLPSATRTGGPDTVELAITALNYPIVRTDVVPWNCPPPPRPTGDHVSYSKSAQPSKPCKTSASPAPSTTPVSSSFASSSTPVTTPASTPQTSTPVKTPGRVTAPRVTTPASVPALANTGASHTGQLALSGVGLAGVGGLLAFAGRRRRGAHQ